MKNYNIFPDNFNYGIDDYSTMLIANIDYKKENQFIETIRTHLKQHKIYSCCSLLELNQILIDFSYFDHNNYNDRIAFEGREYSPYDKYVKQFLKILKSSLEKEIPK